MVSAPLVVEPFGPGSSLARGAGAGVGAATVAGSGFLPIATGAGAGTGVGAGLVMGLAAGFTGALAAGLAGALATGFFTMGLALLAGLAGVGDFFTLVAIFFAAPFLGVGLFAIS